MSKRKAVFLDRDGTLIEAVRRPEFEKGITAPFKFNELQFVLRVRDTLIDFEDLGFLRIMITNQPDVRLGHIKQKVWEDIHNIVISSLPLDDFYMCRHKTQDNCPMKKPSPLMLIAAADKWGIDLSKSYMIGDTDKDTGAGKAAGVKTILIDRDYNAGVEADFHVDSLANSLELIRKIEKSHR